VTNIGTAAETFVAKCTITPGSYTSSVTISNLSPGDDSIVSFPTPWTPGPLCTSYDITMWVELIGDLKNCNDTTSSSTRSWNSIDVINSPFTTIPPTMDGSISPGEWMDAENLEISDILDRGKTGAMTCNSVWIYVKNDSFNVYFAADVNVDGVLENFDTYQFFFDDNNDGVFDSAGTEEGKVRFTAFTTSTDSAYFTAYNPCLTPPEYWASSFLGDAGLSGGNVQFELTIPLNPAGLDEQLNASIGDTVGVWINVFDAFGLFGRSVGWWPTTSNFNVGMSCPDPAEMGDLILGHAEPFRDVGVVRLSVPLGDTICVDTCYFPEAVVENFGGVADSFDVILTINGLPSPWADTQNIFLASGQATINFDSVCIPPDSGVFYGFTVCTKMSGDVNPANDCDGNSFFATPACYNFHDVAVTNINLIQVRPDTCLLVGDSVWIEVEITNYSFTFTETNVNVGVTAPPAPYIDGVVLPFLDTLEKTPFIFPMPFVTPWDTECYDFTVVVSGVAGDRNPVNDTLVERLCGCSVGIEESPESSNIPKVYSLFQSRPNPASRWANIRYGLPRDSQVNLSVYDISGRQVVTLLNEYLKAGYYSTVWDGRDNQGKPVGSGVYFYRLSARSEKTDEFISAKKLILIR
jgi:hypothetical protein